MLIVAGISMRNLAPRVWDVKSDFYLPNLQALMVSYAEFHTNRSLRERAVTSGVRKLLGVSPKTQVFLDNGAFYFARNGEAADYDGYRQFVRAARPDWYPIPFDAIPTPQMSAAKQQACFDLTMRVNVAHHHDGYVPVVHAGPQLENYLAAIERGTAVKKKPALALGGMVPNLLRSPKAAPYNDIIGCLRRVRKEFPNKRLHVFGLGGTATVHLAILLGFTSADSSGWRNRAARGIVQLPGHGDRMVASLGSWRGRRPDAGEWKLLGDCGCAACSISGIDGLTKSGLSGFCNRATHNLHVLLDEAEWVTEQLRLGTYRTEFRQRLNNSTYLPIIERVLAMDHAPL
jgi:7-cyano-7-deazaguanine tRNA-ribosyltransferase